VIDLNTGLTLNTSQYSLAELLQDATMQFGQGVYCVVLITDAAVSNNVVLQYQAVGGEYQNSADGVIAAYQLAMSNSGVVSWASIMNKPVDYPPALHSHLLSDVYGFGAIVSALERIRNAILLNGIPTLTAIVDWFASAIVSETNARVAADDALASSATSESSARIAADTALTADIATEATARTLADTALVANIAAEATNRTAADMTLANGLAAEATNRASADTALTADIAAEATNRTAADTALTADIATEATTRASADTALAASIATETAARLASGFKFKSVNGIALIGNQYITLANLGNWGDIQSINSTYIMPLSSTADIGSTFTFKARYDATILAQGADIFIENMSYGFVTQINLKAGDTITLTCGSNIWVVVAKGNVNLSSLNANGNLYGAAQPALNTWVRNPVNFPLYIEGIVSSSMANNVSYPVVLHICPSLVSDYSLPDLTQKRAISSDFCINANGAWADKGMLAGYVPVNYWFYIETSFAFSVNGNY
jgi:hypothetical protein